MNDNIKKEDLRIFKTEKALVEAMYVLLEGRHFNQLTVNDLCKEALISRVTFYNYFNDKYDFLGYWLKSVTTDIVNKDDTYEQIEKSVNKFVYHNKKIIKNIIENVNDETLDVLSECILYNSPLWENKNKITNHKYIVLSNFYAGGIISHIRWQVKNKFPSDTQMISSYLYDILQFLSEWGLN